MHSVLVLDQVAQTLAVVRSLGRAGYRVILGRGRVKGESESSRHCAEVWRHPPVDDLGFESALMAFIDARDDVRAVFPIGEASAAVIGGVAWLAARGIAVAGVPRRLLVACRDKRTANDLAVAAGLPVPETRTIAGVDGLRSFVNDVGYPIIVKPVRSYTRLFGRKGYILDSVEHQRARFDVWPAEHEELLVQRYVTGPLEQCDYLAADGELICFFQAHAIRTDRTDGTGFAVDFVSDPVDTGVLEACRAFARAHAYTGPGLLQLVRSTADGRLYFIENNPRLSAGIAQAVKCGVDFPHMMLRAAMPASTPLRPVAGGVPMYAVGQRTHWLSRDINGYLDVRRELVATERIRWRHALVNSLRRADAHMTWDVKDPAPSFLIYRRLLTRLFRGDRGAV